MMRKMFSLRMWTRYSMYPSMSRERVQCCRALTPTTLSQGGGKLARYFMLKVTNHTEIVAGEHGCFWPGAVLSETRAEDKKLYRALVVWIKEK